MAACSSSLDLLATRSCSLWMEAFTLSFCCLMTATISLALSVGMPACTAISRRAVCPRACSILSALLKFLSGRPRLAMRVARTSQAALTRPSSLARTVSFFSFSLSSKEALASLKSKRLPISFMATWIDSLTRFMSTSLTASNENSLGIFSSEHGDLELLGAGGLDGQLVAGVGVARHAEGRVVGEHALQAPVHHLGAVGHGHLAGMQRVAHADAPAVMEAHPGRARGGVEEGVEHGPVGHGVGAVLHALGLAVGAGHRAGVQVIAPDDDGRGKLAFLDQVIDAQAHLRALAKAQPGDARRQALEGDLAAGQRDPARERLVLGKELERLGVRDGYVLGLARERRPAERALTPAEQRPDELRDKAGDLVGVAHAGLIGHRADVVAVVEGDGAGPLERQHAAHVLGDGLHDPLEIG